jgi:hypothetical protein
MSSAPVPTVSRFTSEPGGVTTVANHGLGPLVEQGVEWLQDHFKNDPAPEIERPPGYDHEAA